MLCSLDEESPDAATSMRLGECCGNLLLSACAAGYTRFIEILNGDAPLLHERTPMCRAAGLASLIGLGCVALTLAGPPPHKTEPVGKSAAATAPVSGAKTAALAKPAPLAEAERWIDSLGSRDFRTREKATRAIVAIGPTALPTLQKARSHQEAEVRARVNELITVLERAAALAPRRVTLKMDRKPVKDVLNEIARQTGFKIPTTDAAFNEQQARTLQSFEFKDTLFWEALDKVCEKYGLILQNGNADPTVRLVFQDSYEPFRSYDGSFKVLATGFQYSRNNHFGYMMKTPYRPGNLGNEYLLINLSVAAEPRVPILKVSQVKLTQAEDENKCSMLAEGSNYWARWNSRYYGGSNRAFVHPASTFLAWPSKAARTVKVLKGMITVTLLAEEKLVAVTDNLQSANGKKFKIGAATFTIDSLGTTGSKQHEVKITYNEDAGDNNWDYSRIQGVPQKLELHDANGKKVPADVRIMNYLSATSAQFSIVTQTSANNAKTVSPAKLMFQLWVQMEHEVQFEFHNLPLP